MTKNKVIILGSHFNALSMVQIFGKENIPVDVLSDVKDHAGRSKYANWIKTPNPIHAPENFKKFLIAYCKKEASKPVVIPSMDQWAYLLSQCNLEKNRLAHAVVDCPETLKILLNKDDFSNFCTKNGFSVPKKYEFQNVQNIPSESFPLVIKPNFRMNPSGTAEQSITSAELNKLRFVIIRNKLELDTFIQTHPHTILSELVLQEYISGFSDSMITYGVYAKNGEIIGAFEGRKVRGYPHEYGDCIVGKESDIPIQIKEEAKQLLRTLNYSGIAEIEYKQDSIKGSCHLIEVNPRSWSWIGITQFTEHNLPLIAYRDKLGLPQLPNSSRIEDQEIYFRRRSYDRFNCLYRYPKFFPAWAMSRSKWKKFFNGKFTYDIETANKDYAQWAYTYLKNNIILYTNWFLRNK